MYLSCVLMQQGRKSLSCNEHCTGWFGISCLLLIPMTDAMRACVYLCRDCARHDLRDQPRNGDVLGHVSVDVHGDHGKTLFCLLE